MGAMREILFRGKRISDGEWVEGYLGVEVGGAPVIEYCGTDEDVGDYVEEQFVNPESIGEFTGLTDKNGVKIFEGDIICGKAGPPFEIRWRKSMCYFSIYAKDVPYPLAPVEKGIVRNYEVIGNIYDNPELLEGKS